MIPTLLAQIGLPLLVKAVQSGLRAAKHPAAKVAVDALAEVDTAIKRAEISPENMAAAHRHIETMRGFDRDEFKTLIEQVNTSLRTEVAADDIYVRRMRPTFGYIMAITILTDPASAGALMQGLGHLSTIWTVGLSVLGVYVYKRSQEKMR